MSEKQFDEIIKAAIGPNKKFSQYLQEIDNDDTVGMTFGIPLTLSKLMDEYGETWKQVYKSRISKRVIMLRMLALIEDELRKELILLRENLDLLQELQ